MINILTEQNVQRSLAALESTDILIEPELGEYSAADFDNITKTVPIGEAAARKVADRLAPLALAPQAYAQLRARQTVDTPPALPRIDEIRFSELKRVNPAAAQSVMATQPGTELRRDTVDADMRRIYGTGHFEHVNYRVDSAIFPRHGYAGSATINAPRGVLGAERSYTRWEADWVGATSLREHTLQLGVHLGGTLGEAPLPVNDYFTWGGFLQQSGYRTGALLGEGITFGRLVYYQRVLRQSLLEGLYAGVSLEAGRVTNPLVSTMTQAWQKSASAFLGADTPLGPLYVAYGRTATNNSSFYLYLGRP